MTIEEIFNNAVDSKASDIHLASNTPVLYRIDGVLKPMKDSPCLKYESILSLIESIISKDQRNVLFKDKCLELSYQTKNDVRLRINIYWEKGELSLAARLISPRIPTMKEVDLPESARKLADARDGLFLVTGPTGCGKSTTLAAILDYINEKRACHIITLEDPIEFVFKPKKSLISQRELGRDMTSFQSALKHIVRQNPDVILVSEMRDLETIGLAITLAETGHLVLATLHTPNAPQTIDRIIDIFPTDQQKQIRLQIALSLKAIISQHLLPKIGAGRVAAREILVNTPAVANLIRDNKVAQIRSALQTGLREGMCTLEQDLKRLYRLGLITLETATSQANYPEEILKE